MALDGQDMDLTDPFKDQITASMVFEESGTFTLNINMFGNITKTDGNYVIKQAGKLTFFADGNLSSGSYSFEGDTLILAENISGKETTLYLERSKVGEVVTFGAYDQDNNTANGKEPIEWIVLDQHEDGSLVLLSKYALDAVPYNDVQADVTWETCTLRRWLNEDFYNAAFSAGEQAKIVPVTLENEDNPFKGTPGGKATQDKVWLLSINEVCDYFTNDKVYSCFTDDASRMCAPTKYAVAQGAYQNSSYTVDGVGACWWWLRSPGNYSRRAAFVDIGNSSVRPVVVALP